MTPRDDRAAPARIRDAAIDLVSTAGWDKTTSRQIAAAAGLPVGLVNYHFGSKDGLRRACDDHVIALIAQEKGLVLSGGPLPRMDTYIAEHPEMIPISEYIAASMRSGGPVAEAFFDRMVTMTVEMMELAADAGTFRRYDDPYAVAVILVAFGVGASLYGDSIARHLGGANLIEGPTYQRYARSTLEILTYPLLTDDRYLRSLDTPDQGEPTKENE